jgi:tetratricopeptide (TPR) repeat protein
MSQTENFGPVYKTLKWVAILGGIAWISFEFYRHFSGMAPGDISFVDGGNLFKDGQYERAAEYYSDTVEKNPRHGGALRGIANSNVQLKRYDKAMAAIERAIQLQPKFGGNYAIRGIIYDHAGRHRQAMEDYEKSLIMDPEVADGMHWLDRLLKNVQEKPPTVADRLEYLKHQFALPESKRMLRIPDEDDKQLPYSR